MNLFPVALNLKGRTCVVVGAGAVGARKAFALAECGASVVVVAPTITPKLQETIQAGAIRHIAAPFRPEYLDGAFLCVAATDQPEVNREIAGAAHERGVLLNLASPAAGADTDAEEGDFVTMASVRRSDLLLAVTTGGAGPSLAAQLRRDWETHYGSEWSLYVDLLGEARRMLKQYGLGEVDRTQIMRNLVENNSLLPLLQAGELAAARALVLSLVEAGQYNRRDDACPSA